MSDGLAESRVILLERLINGGQWERVARTALDWLAEEPRNIQAHRAAGLALVNLRRSKEAMTHLREVLAQNPQDANAHQWMSGACDQELHYDQAEKHIRKAIQLEPENAAHWYHLASSCQRHRRYRDAAKYARRALELQPDQADIINLLAMCERADPQKRAELYGAALALDPGSAWVHNNLGVHHLASAQDPLLAARGFRHALSLDPTNKVARSNLAAARNQLADLLPAYDRLCGRLRRVLQFYGSSLVIRLVLIITGLLLSSGRYALAVCCLWLFISGPLFLWPLSVGYESLLLHDLCADADLLGLPTMGTLNFWRWPRAIRLGLSFGGYFLAWGVLWWLCAVPARIILLPIVLVMVLTALAVVWEAVRTGWKLPTHSELAVSGDEEATGSDNRSPHHE